MEKNSITALRQMIPNNLTHKALAGFLQAIGSAFQ